jgi:hypothetical protein
MSSGKTVFLQRVDSISDQVARKRNGLGYTKYDGGWGGAVMVNTS